MYEIYDMLYLRYSLYGGHVEYGGQKCCPKIHFMKFCPIQYFTWWWSCKKLSKTVIIRPSLWEWAGWIRGHSALFLSLLWAFSSPQRYHQSINTAISRWIILSSSINTFAHDRCFHDKKKQFPDTRLILRWWLCSLLIHAHLSSWHQGASSATFFYWVILQKHSLWGGGGSS